MPKCGCERKCECAEKCCCKKVDCLIVENRFVSKGSTTLENTTRVDKVCFKDNGDDGKRWCAQEGDDNVLRFSYEGTSSTISLLPDGTLQTSGNVLIQGEKLEPEGVIAESTEIVTYFNGSVVGALPTATKSMTFIIIDDVNATVQVPNGVFDGQVKRFAIVTPVALGVATLAGQFLFKASRFVLGVQLNGASISAASFMWSTSSAKWVLFATDAGSS